MKRSFLFVLILLGGLIGFFVGQWFYARSVSDFDSGNFELIPIAIESPEGFRAEFEVVVATTTEARRKGLQIVSRLGSDEGMWFVFEAEAERQFWMKDMAFPLDLLFVNSNFEIVSLVEEAPPCREVDPEQSDCPVYSSVEPVQYVLEIPAGSVQAQGIRLGDRVVFPLDS